MRRALPLIALVLAACEVPLDPIAESDLSFALSGYLDASADTQWVRVERVDPVAGVERAAPRAPSDVRKAHSIKARPSAKAPPNKTSKPIIRDAPCA